MNVIDEVIFDNEGIILTKREEEIARKAFKEWGDTDSDNELSFEEYLGKIWFNNEIPQQNNDQITTSIEESIIKSESIEGGFFATTPTYKTQTIKEFIGNGRKFWEWTWAIFTLPHPINTKGAPIDILNELGGKEKFTLLLPTERAFKNLIREGFPQGFISPEDDFKGRLSNVFEENPETRLVLKRILSNHIIENEVLKKKDIFNKMQRTTKGGNTITFKIYKEKPEIRVNIFKRKDIALTAINGETKNGIIYYVDEIFLSQDDIKYLNELKKKPLIKSNITSYIDDYQTTTLIENDFFYNRGISGLMEDHVGLTIKLLIALNKGDEEIRAIINLLKNKKMWVEILRRLEVDQQTIDQWYTPPEKIDVAKNQLGEGIFLEHSKAVLSVFKTVKLDKDTLGLIPKEGIDPKEFEKEEKERETYAQQFVKALDILTKTNPPKVVEFWTSLLPNLDKKNFATAWQGHLTCTVKYATQFLISKGDETDSKFGKKVKKCLDQGIKVGRMIDIAIMNIIGKSNSIIKSEHNEPIERFFLKSFPYKRNKEKTIEWFLDQNLIKEKTFWAWTFFNLKKIGTMRDGPWDILQQLNIVEKDKKFTLLLPNNEAFIKLIENTLKKKKGEEVEFQLMLSSPLFENNETARTLVKNILENHIIPMEIFSNTIKSRTTVRSIRKLETTFSKNAKTVNNVKIEYKDTKASNGVIHIIDQVILTFGDQKKLNELIGEIKFSKQTNNIDLNLSNIPVLKSKRKIIDDDGDDNDIDLSTIPVLESKRFTECNCDSTNLELQRKKVPQQRHEVILPEILESKRHFVETNNVKQKMISNSLQDVSDIPNITSQLVPKNRLHMDNSLKSNHNSKPKTIGIREEANIIYGVTRLSNYVNDKEAFYDRFNNSRDAKKLINELKQMVNSLDEHKSEENPAEHLKSSNGLYSLLNHQKISDMNKSEMIGFIVAVDSLSHALQEYRYDKSILKAINNK